MNPYFLFCYSFCLANILSLVIPSFRPLYFAPFIVLTLYRCPLNQTLWWSIGCGLLIDLFSSQTRLGIFALNYCLTTFLLSSYKTHFFEDRPSTLPMMTFAYAALSNMLQLALFFATGTPITLTWDWFQNELIYIPFQTAVYGICAFYLGHRFFKRVLTYRKRALKR